VKPLNCYTCTLTPEQAVSLKSFLDQAGFVSRDVPHARFAGDKGKVGVVFYKSGKLVVQGRETREFVEFVLEPEILKEVRLGYETALDPGILQPRIGVDESGKGDFFGPLCIAGAYVNETVVKSWMNAGEIRDSKNISSDKKIAELAGVIRDTPGCVTAVVPIGNEAYNRLHAKLGSVNAILAWGHARVIENLLGQKHRMNPPPVRAISDQFSRSKATVERAMMSLGREIELVQRHKAEADLAVAAASILARHEFVTRLNLLGRKFGVVLPKGASSAVVEAGRKFVEKCGASRLGEAAKLHFKTTQVVAGVPSAGACDGTESEK
jgi:ribonuclease HIII